jgi:hypothetical protein
VDSSVGRVRDGRLSVLRRTHILGRLPSQPATRADTAAGDGADGKHGHDDNHDHQCGTGDPPTNRRFLFLQLLIVRVRAAVALAVRGLPMRGLSSCLAVGLAALTVALAALRCSPGANETL